MKVLARCWSKRSFPDRQAAQAAKTSMLAHLAGRRNLNIYKCGICGRFHVGHRKGNRR